MIDATGRDRSFEAACRWLVPWHWSCDRACEVVMDWTVGPLLREGSLRGEDVRGTSSRDGFMESCTRPCLFRSLMKKVACATKPSADSIRSFEIDNLRLLHECIQATRSVTSCHELYNASTASSSGIESGHEIRSVSFCKLRDFAARFTRF